MSRTVLVTGANGTVSSAVLSGLEGAGLNLRALVRDESKRGALTAKGVEVFVGDLDEPSSLPPAFKGVDDVWLLTVASPRAPENSMNAIWAARQAGVSRVVRMSGIGAAHDSPTRIGRLHALSDEELMTSGLEWTILRPYFFMQNLLAAAGTIAAQDTIYMNMGEAKVGMVDARDIGALAAQVLKESGRHNGKIYGPSGPESISLADAAEALSSAVGRKVTYVAVPHEAARTAMLDAGLSPWLIAALAEYADAYMNGLGDSTTHDFPEVVGKPPRSIADFARDFSVAFGREAAPAQG